MLQIETRTEACCFESYQVFRITVKRIFRGLKGCYRQSATKELVLSR
mgnify:CR=1 FL=1